ncbi:hypothetical protein K438DRAFT_1910612 [Mycena galopus ATCC 62051]|nr:hypothetical protein K438DRAFT_1910612 [Mycena galopus ATCC 62051]
MHLVWENIIKTLILLWAGEHKGMDEGLGSYHLEPTVFEAIGAAGKMSGDSIPSWFGPRIPDIVNEHYYFIADTWSTWTMSLGSILLRQRFKSAVYYTHFVSLVGLLHLCLQFEISMEDIDKIETGMAAWVQEFEKLYYQYKLDCLPVCTLPIHGLLYIAPSIWIVGPSWRHPWVSIDRRILELAQLFQLKAVYSLATTLDLRWRRKVENSGMSLAGYPRCVLVNPRELCPLSDLLRKQISTHLASIYNSTSDQLLSLIPTPVEHWGKIQWLEGGDMMHASEIGKHGTRDMTYVKFNGFYGQLRLLLVIKLEPSEVIQTTTTKIHLLAVVARSIMTQKNRLNMPHTKGKFHAVEVIDAEDLEFVAGRVPDRGEYVFIERVNCNNVLEAHDDPEDSIVPRNHRQRRVEGR